jgi:hypothetical protein
MVSLNNRIMFMSYRVSLLILVLFFSMVCSADTVEEEESLTRFSVLNTEI